MSAKVKNHQSRKSWLLNFLQREICSLHSTATGALIKGESHFSVWNKVFQPLSPAISLVSPLGPEQVLAVKEFLENQSQFPPYSELCFVIFFVRLSFFVLRIFSPKLFPKSHNVSSIFSMKEHKEITQSWQHFSDCKLVWKTLF